MPVLGVFDQIVGKARPGLTPGGGGGGIPYKARYMELRPNGVPFSGWRYMKG